MGEFLIGNKTHLVCYQKDRVSFRSMSVHLYLNYDASRAHRRGRGDKQKIDIILLVTMRPIAHSGRSVCIQNCVGEFGTDTGQSLVTTKGM